MARIDVTVAIVAFLALRAGLLEGAVAAYAVGYLLDLMTGQPTGLYTLLALVTFLLGRIAASLVDVRSAMSFAGFAMAADVAHGLLAWGISAVSGKQLAPGRAVGAAAGGGADRAGGAGPLSVAAALRARRRAARAGAPGHPMTLGQSSAGKDLKARYLWLGRR